MRPYNHDGEEFRRRLSKLDDSQCGELLAALKLLLKHPTEDERRAVIRTFMQLGLQP